MRQSKFIGELPSGYEWKFLQTDYVIKLIGVSHDKPPIGFILNGTELERIDLEYRDENHGATDCPLQDLSKI